jgi:hypothetical protein
VDFVIGEFTFAQLDFTFIIARSRVEIRRGFLPAFWPVKKQDAQGNIAFSLSYYFCIQAQSDRLR